MFSGIRGVLLNPKAYTYKGFFKFLLNFVFNNPKGEVSGVVVS